MTPSPATSVHVVELKHKAHKDTEYSDQNDYLPRLVLSDAQLMPAVAAGHDD